MLQQMLDEARENMAAKPKPVGGNVANITVNRAAVQPDVAVKIRVRGKGFDVDKVLLDSGAWICIFGDNFLQELLAGGALKAKIDLLESLDVYRVSGIHNHGLSVHSL